MKGGGSSIDTSKGTTTVPDRSVSSTGSDSVTAPRGLFITFEGIDGSGKSTQAESSFRGLIEELGEDRLVRTFEPGGWAGGETIRSTILRGDLKSVFTETLLFLADRAEHVERVIGPGLTSGKLVLCERFSDSTLAYQVFGKGFPREILEEINARAGFPRPDITFWFDVPVAEAIGRIVARKGVPDRFEKDGALLERIRLGYETICSEEPERFIRLDGTAKLDHLNRTVVTKILGMLKESRGIS
jgi:dTMP kinase